MSDERILHAAVKTESGQIIFGKQHADCFAKAHYMNIKMSKKREDQGFLTSNGRYVDRVKGAQIAFDSGQTDRHEKILFSENLWCDLYNAKHVYDELRGYVLKCISNKKDKE